MSEISLGSMKKISVPSCRGMAVPLQKATFHLEHSISLGGKETQTNQSPNKQHLLKEWWNRLPCKLLLNVRLKLYACWICFKHCCVQDCRQPIPVTVRGTVRWKCQWGRYEDVL